MKNITEYLLNRKDKKNGIVLRDIGDGKNIITKFMIKRRGKLVGYKGFIIDVSKEKIIRGRCR